jgi:hypothetical protein
MERALFDASDAVGVLMHNIWCFYMLACRRRERGDHRFGAAPVRA